MKNFHFPPKEDANLFGATEYSVSPFLVGGCSIPKGLCTLHSSSYCRKKVVALNMPAVCATCILRMSMLVATLPITHTKTILAFNFSCHSSILHICQAAEEVLLLRMRSLYTKEAVWAFQGGASIACGVTLRQTPLGNSYIL